jgi:hypothetical protein
MASALLLIGYCAVKAGSSSTRWIAGGFHFPVSASDFGLYRRMVRLNAPFGAGSQLLSLSLPGRQAQRF